MKVVFVCDWLPPDFGAVGQYTLKFAREEAARGSRVTLGGLCTGAGSETFERHGSGTLRVVRLHTSSNPKHSFLRRALWTFVTNIRLVGRLVPSMVRSEEVLFTGSPPYLIHLIVPLSLVFRFRTRYRITDFHPECLMVALPRVPVWLRALYAVTLFWRRKVGRFEVLGEDQRVRLREIGIADDRIILKRDESPITFGPDTRPAAKPKTIQGIPVVLYSGNYGLAHDVGTFLRGWGLYHQRGGRQVGFWLNATGTQAAAVHDRATQLALRYARTEPAALEDLPGILLAADMHLITLRDEFVGYVLPSKVYACIDSGKPVLFVGSERSDVHLLCSERMNRNSYFRVDIGDAQGIVSALEQLAAHVDNGG